MKCTKFIELSNKVAGIIKENSWHKEQKNVLYNYFVVQKPPCWEINALCFLLFPQQTQLILKTIKATLKSLRISSSKTFKDINIILLY